MSQGMRWSSNKFLIDFMLSEGKKVAKWPIIISEVGEEVGGI